MATYILAYIYFTAVIGNNLSNCAIVWKKQSNASIEQFVKTTVEVHEKYVHHCSPVVNVERPVMFALHKGLVQWHNIYQDVVIGKKVPHFQLGGFGGGFYSYCTAKDVFILHKQLKSTCAYFILQAELLSVHDAMDFAKYTYNNFYQPNMYHNYGIVWFNDDLTKKYMKTQDYYTSQSHDCKEYFSKPQLLGFVMNGPSDKNNLSNELHSCDICDDGIDLTKISSNNFDNFSMNPFRYSILTDYKRNCVLVKRNRIKSGGNSGSDHVSRTRVYPNATELETYNEDIKKSFTHRHPYVNLIHTLAQVLNFKVQNGNTSTVKTDRSNRYRTPPRTCHRVIALANSPSRLSEGLQSINIANVKSAIFNGLTVFYTKRPNRMFLWYAPLNIYPKVCWVLIISSVIASGYVFNLSQKMHISMFHKNSYLGPFKLLLCHGIPYFPQQTSRRMIFIVWIWYAYFIYNGYNAFLLSYLTTPKSETVPKTANELVESDYTYGLSKKYQGSVGTPELQIIKQNDKAIQQRKDSERKLYLQSKGCKSSGAYWSEDCHYTRPQGEKEIMKDCDSSIHVYQDVACFLDIEKTVYNMISHDSDSNITFSMPVINFTVGTENTNNAFHESVDIVNERILSIGLNLIWSEMSKERQILTAAKSSRNRTRKNMVTFELEHLQLPFAVIILGLVITSIVFINEISFSKKGSLRQ